MLRRSPTFNKGLNAYIPLEKKETARGESTDALLSLGVTLAMTEPTNAKVERVMLHHYHD